MQKIPLSYTVTIVATVYTVAISLLNFFYKKFILFKRFYKIFMLWKLEPYDKWMGFSYMGKFTHLNTFVIKMAQRCSDNGGPTVFN